MVLIFFSKFAFKFVLSSICERGAKQNEAALCWLGAYLTKKKKKSQEGFIIEGVNYCKKIKNNCSNECKQMLLERINKNVEKQRIIV